MNRGFEQKLGLKVLQKNTIYSEIEFYTLGVPQFVHSIALYASRAALSSDCLITSDTVKHATLRMLRDSIFKHYSTIESRVRKSNIDYRKYCAVLKIISNFDSGHFFVSSVINALRRDYLLNTFYDKDVYAIVRDLCEEPNPILRYDSNLENYTFNSPEVRLCMRVLISSEHPSGPSLIEMDGFRSKYERV